MKNWLRLVCAAAALAAVIMTSNGCSQPAAAPDTPGAAPSTSTPGVTSNAPKGTPPPPPDVQKLHALQGH